MLIISQMCSMVAFVELLMQLNWNENLIQVCTKDDKLKLYISLKVFTNYSFYDKMKFMSSILFKLRIISPQFLASLSTLLSNLLKITPTMSSVAAGIPLGIPRRNAKPFYATAALIPYSGAAILDENRNR